MEKLLTLSEAAALINVHPETLRRWDRDGTLVAVKVNDRGDRRYQESNLVEFMKTHKSTIQYNQSLNYSDYIIKWWDNNGFNTIQSNFDLMAKIYATKDNEFIGFIFYVSFLNKSKINEDELDKLAMGVVKHFFDTKKASDGDRFTFEFDGQKFIEIQNPEWWEEKYSKTLVPKLRVVAQDTCPVTMQKKAWRVTLQFKSKQGEHWFTNTFGTGNVYHEYFVWIDAKELISRGLPNTEKGAEILAVDFGVQRFEETKDINGNRDITKISENNAACFEGKFIKDKWLPKALME